MTRVDKDEYSVLIRSDYLYALGRIAPNRQHRDQLIQDAVRSFIEDYDFKRRAEEIDKEESRVSIMSRYGHRPSYRMYLQFIRLPDSLVRRMENAGQDPLLRTRYYDSLGTVLNTAIRLFLDEKHSGVLQRETGAAVETGLTNRA